MLQMKELLHFEKGQIYRRLSFVNGRRKRKAHALLASTSFQTGGKFWPMPRGGVGRGGGRGILRISSDGAVMIEGYIYIYIFFFLKFSIPGVFWVGKFGKFYFGWDL